MADATWPFNETADRRFWAKVDVRGPDECWPWAAGVTSRGYGRFRPGGHETQPSFSSRCAWALTHGVWPSPKTPICHTCDNPPCCNPAHLYLGTPASNMADKVARGRHTQGETHPLAHLDDQKVREIRALRAQGVSRVDLAARFGVAPGTIDQIARRARWAHVE